LNVFIILLQEKRKFLVLAGVAAVTLAFADPPANFSGWDKVFEDNFDGTSLDKKKWNPTYNWGPTHNHRAYCAEENVIVSDGTLKLKGEKKTHPDASGRTAKFNGKEIPVDYTSGAIDTKGHFEVKYGYIEGRFKAPSQKGTWPAFWTLQDGWPREPKAAPLLPALHGPELVQQSRLGVGPRGVLRRA